MTVPLPQPGDTDWIDWATDIHTTTHTAAPRRLPVRSVSADTTAIIGEVLQVDGSGGARTITPPASPGAGDWVWLVKTDSTTNNVTWNGTTHGDSTAVVTGQWTAAQFVWNGARWVVLATNRL